VVAQFGRVVAVGVDRIRALQRLGLVVWILPHPLLAVHDCGQTRDVRVRIELVFGVQLVVVGAGRIGCAAAVFLLPIPVLISTLILILLRVPQGVGFLFDLHFFHWTQLFVVFEDSRERIRRLRFHLF